MTRVVSLGAPRLRRKVPRHASRRPSGRSVADNVGARLIALVAVAGVTVLVARTGGAVDVGLLALLRVLPGLVGVLAAIGLPGSMGFFVGGPERTHPALWTTVVGVMTLGAAAGTLAWFALTPLIHQHLMATTTVGVVAVAGVTVATQLPVAVGKAALQALDDSHAANVVTATEEVAFIPAFLVLYLGGLRGGWLLVLALLLADVVVAWGAWVRIRTHLRSTGQRLVGRVDRPLAVRVVRFGARNQVGGIVGLLNLRFDFIVLGAMAGPAAVGVYAVASKYAELLRLPALAVTWVAYPRVARSGAAGVGRRVRRLLPRLVALGAVTGALLAVLAFPVLPWVYGPEFAAAAWPAAIISLGLVAEPAAGLGSAFLLGTGRPGLNSTLLAVGLVLTLVLDLLLIPRHAAVGAAWASAVAYAVTDVLLIAVLWRRTGRLGAGTS